MNRPSDEAVERAVATIKGCLRSADVASGERSLQVLADRINADSMSISALTHALAEARGHPLP